MKELFLLTKIFFKSSIDFSRKKKGRLGSYLYLMLFGILFALVFAFLCFTYYQGLIGGKDAPKHSIMIVCLVFLSFVGFVLNFLSMYSALFKAKDFDFLASSPLKKSNIIAAKLLALFLFSLVIDIVAMIPVLIFYMVNGGTWIGLLAGIVGTIFAGIVPLLFSTLVGSLVGLITMKLKNGDTITIIVYLVLFLGLTGGLMFLISSSNIILSGDKVLPYFRFLTYSIVNNNPIGILWFALINIGASLLVIIFASIIYFPINQAKKNNGDGRYVSGREKTNITTTRFLFNKEMRMITKNPLFILSTYALPLICLIMGFVMTGIIGKGFFAKDTKTINLVLTQLNFWITGMSILIASLCVPTYASFSMEGRNNFEQLFVYPLDKKKIINAKMKASIIPLSIIFGISGLLLVLVFSIIQGFDKIPVWTWLNIIILPILASISSTLIGTLCGIKWIKLDFVDQNDLLKKSKAMAFNALFSGLLNIVIFGGYLAISIFLPKMPYLGLIVGVSAEIIAIIILAIAVNKNGEKMLNKALIR